QHNKMIVVDGPKVKAAVGGSTNFSWRGFFVQSNNALVVRGADAIAPFAAAFEGYWATDSASVFGGTEAAGWKSLGFENIDAEVSFSPHGPDNVRLKAIADDVKSTT